MIPILRGAFKDLYALYEADCVTRWLRCEAVATQMANTSRRPRGTFEGLADEAQKIAEDTTQTRDLREKARLAAIARQKEIEAQDAEMQRVKTSLAEQIPGQAGTRRPRPPMNAADGRMFTLAIVGSITKALGDGLSAALQFKAAGDRWAPSRRRRSPAMPRCLRPRKTGRPTRSRRRPARC